MDPDPALPFARQQKNVVKQWVGFAIMGVLVVGASVAALTYQRAQTDTPTNRDARLDASSGAAGPEVVPGAVTSLKKSSQLFPKVLPAATHELPALDFTALNPYHVRDGKPAQDYPWLKDVKLVEPFRETTFTVSAPRDGFEYRWKFFAIDKDETGELRAEESGSQAVAVLTALGDNFVLLEEVDEKGEVARRLKERIVVKYVRREIRTLMDDEREELLDAVSTTHFG